MVGTDFYNILLKWFNNNSDQFKIDRKMYAIKAGTFKGDFLVPIDFKPLQQSIDCLSLPDKEIRIIPLNEFKKGLKHSIIEPIETLPRDIFKICQAEFQQALEHSPKNENNLNS